MRGTRNSCWIVGSEESPKLVLPKPSWKFLDLDSECYPRNFFELSAPLSRVGARGAECSLCSVDGKVEPKFS